MFAHIGSSYKALAEGAQPGSRLHSCYYRTSNPSSGTGRSTKLKREPHIFPPFSLHCRSKRRKHLRDGHCSPKRRTGNSQLGGIGVYVTENATRALTLVLGLKSGRCGPRNCTAPNSQLIVTDFSTGLLLSRVVPYHLDKAQVFYF